jgi:hypothetical protein
MRAFLLLAALALPACHPCVEVCNDQVSAYEACLGSWDLGWAELGAQDANDWWEQCSDNQSVYTASLDSETSGAEGTQCGGLRDQLRASQDCDARWSALTDYGTHE